jgi:ribonuclease P protein component
MPRIARKITQFTQAEIKHLFRAARTIFKDAGLTIRRAPSSGEFGRLLIVTPKKVGNAPQRNKLRRQLKSIFYQQKLYSQPFDLIVQCSKETTLLSFQELKKNIISVYPPTNILPTISGSIR